MDSMTGGTSSQPPVSTDVANSVENLRAIEARLSNLVDRFQAWHDKVRGVGPTPPIPGAQTPQSGGAFDQGLNGALQRIHVGFADSCRSLEELLDSTTKYL